MGIADEIRRRFGIRTQQDRDEAQRAMDALRRNPSPEAALAVAVADGLVGQSAVGRSTMPDGLVRIMVPEAADGAKPLPTDPLARRLHIAEAVMRTTARHLQYGYAEGLGPELGRAVREEGIRSTALAHVMAGSLDETLRTSSRRLGEETAAYLAHGDAVERRHQADLREAPRRGDVRDTVSRLSRIAGASRAPEGGTELAAWVDRGLRTERAIARSGLMPPAEIVRTAHAVLRHAPVDELKGAPRPRPDFRAAAAMGADERAAAVAGWRTTAEHTTPQAAVPAAPPTPQRAPSGIVAGRIDERMAADIRDYASTRGTINGVPAWFAEGVSVAADYFTGDGKRLPGYERLPAAIADACQVGTAEDPKGVAAFLVSHVDMQKEAAERRGNPMGHASEEHFPDLDGMNRDQLGRIASGRIAAELSGNAAAMDRLRSGAGIDRPHYDEYPPKDHIAHLADLVRMDLVHNLPPVGAPLEVKAAPTHARAVGLAIASGQGI